jgi:hypothetical protein
VYRPTRCNRLACRRSRELKRIDYTDRNNSITGLGPFKGMGVIPSEFDIRHFRSSHGLVRVTKVTCIVSLEREIEEQPFRSIVKSHGIAMAPKRTVTKFWYEKD